ncbi:MAG: hypothetical protein LBS99_04420 [Clostridiales bacterium]|nr:hypothetical protein [Clostridiales bacterium]
MKKRFLPAVLAAALALSSLIAACSPSKPAAPAPATAVAYGRVHGAGYIGRVQITANKNGAVSAAEIDETFFPVLNGWTAYTAGVYGADGFEDYYAYGAEEAPITTAYAKYIRIDERTFEAAGTAATPVYRETSGNVYDLEKLLQSGDDGICGWYYDAVTTGKAQILKKDGEILVADTPAKHSSVTFNKRGADSAYWQAGGAGLGWKANIAALEDYIIAYGMNYAYDSFSKSEESGYTSYWEINDALTGATLSDMGDYLLLAIKAYDLARAQQ